MMQAPELLPAVCKAEESLLESCSVSQESVAEEMALVKELKTILQM